MTRQELRRIARIMGTEVGRRVLGKYFVKSTRKTRRYIGRAYGNAAYRALKGLPQHETGYGRYRPHAGVVEWLRNKLPVESPST